MKKKITMILGCALVACFIAGCGKKAVTNKDASMEKVDNSAVEEVEEEVVEEVEETVDEVAETPDTEGQEEAKAEETAKTAYEKFLAGDRTLLDDAQADTWFPDFQDESMRFEYTYLDLNDDGISELIVQMEDDPGGYNGVFHFEDSRLFCWNCDSVESLCRDYPLDNGNMVRQYDYGGTRSYTIFRYQDNGEMENVANLFARDELVWEDSMEPCPYYEIDGEEVDKDEFDAQLSALVVDRLLDRSTWIAI